MKTTLVAILIFITSFIFAGVIMYLLFAFANYDLNAGNWDTFDRGFSSFVAFVISIFLSAMYISYFEKNKN